jgi:hypothetical protein
MVMVCGIMSFTYLPMSHTYPLERVGVKRIVFRALFRFCELSVPFIVCIAILSAIQYSILDSDSSYIVERAR